MQAAYGEKFRWSTNWAASHGREKLVEQSRGRLAMNMETRTMGRTRFMELSTIRPVFVGNSSGLGSAIFIFSDIMKETYPSKHGFAIKIPMNPCLFGRERASVGSSPKHEVCV